MDKLAKSLFVFSLSVCDVVAFTLLSSAIVAIIYIIIILYIIVPGPGHGSRNPGRRINK